MSVPQGPFTAQVQRALGMLLNFPTASLPVTAPIGQIVFDSTTNTVKVTTDGSTWTAVGGSGVPTYPLLAPNGSAGAPSYSFSANPTVGIYYSGGIVIADPVSGVITLGQKVQVPSGIQAAPGIAGSTFASTGIYWSAGPTLNLSVNNVTAASLTGANLKLGGPDAAAPAAQTLAIQGSRGGTDTNIAGAQLTVVTGLGTGTGVPTQLHFQGPANGTASGTTAQVAIDREVINCSKVLTNNTVTSLVNCTLASNSSVGGTIEYTVEANDGTNFGTESGCASFACYNKGGVFSGNTVTKYGTTAPAPTSGTLVVTLTITAANPAVIQINSNSSLVTTTNRVTYTIRNYTQQAIAVQ